MLKLRLFTQRVALLERNLVPVNGYVCPSCRAHLSTSARRSKQDAPFRTRLLAALRDTKVQWKPIPVGLGIAFVGALQFYRVQARDKRLQEEEEASIVEHDGEDETKPRPKRRRRIRPNGPW